MIHDKIFDLAQDPACLMALTPHHGGAWWSARREDMADPTPRNFATSTANWSDLGAVSAVDMDDWEFGGELYLNELTAGKYLIYRSADPRIGLYASSATLIQMVNYSATGAASTRLYAYNNPPLSTWIKWRMQRVNGWLRWFIDDTEVMASDKTGEYLAMDSTATLTSNGDSFMRNVYFKNLSSGKMLWHYPNPAERLGLITKTGALTLNGVFAAGPGSNVYSVAIPSLNLVGRSGAWTFLSRARKIQSAGDQFFGQGYQTYGTQAIIGHTFNSNGKFTFNTGFRNTSGSLMYRSYLTTEELYLNRWYDFAIVVDMDNEYVAFYIDAVEVNRRTLPGVAYFDMTYDDVVKYPFVVGSTTSGTRCQAEVAYAFVLNRVLSAAEIESYSQE